MNQGPSHIQNRSTRPIQVGPLTIGGGAITVQSMAATRTQDLAATRRQIQLLEAAGADLIRIAVDSKADVEALAILAAETQVPLSVDLQENYRLAEAVAPHVQKVRYNPGHLHHHEKQKSCPGKSPLDRASRIAAQPRYPHRLQRGLPGTGVRRAPRTRQRLRPGGTGRGPLRLHG